MFQTHVEQIFQIHVEQRFSPAQERPGLAEQAQD